MPKKVDTEPLYDGEGIFAKPEGKSCLLYTSDAADE